LHEQSIYLGTINPINISRSSNVETGATRISANEALIFIGFVSLIACSLNFMVAIGKQIKIQVRKIWLCEELLATFTKYGVYTF
jgi:hypothetical protein